MRTFVDDNSAQVLTLSGKPIYSYFFSSSGGASLNIKDVWGGGDVSYLQSVPDPWSLDSTLNPRYIGWSRFVSQETMAQVFGLGDVLTYVINSRTPSGSIASITAVSSTGQQSTLTGEVFRSRVRLPSTWIYNSPSNVRYRLSAIEWDGFSNLRTIAAF
jgi:stage II sporulation protein D